MFIAIGIVFIIIMFRLRLAMELLIDNHCVPIFFHLEYLINVDILRIRSVVYIIQEWYQVK